MALRLFCCFFFFFEIAFKKALITHVCLPHPSSAFLIKHYRLLTYWSPCLGRISDLSKEDRDAFVPRLFHQHHMGTCWKCRFGGVLPKLEIILASLPFDPQYNWALRFQND